MDELFPDGEYRPIPIVWFTGAFIAQVGLLLLCFFGFYAFPPAFTWIASFLVTLWIGLKAWDRGMRTASRWWKTTTIAILAFNLGLVVLGSLDRIPFSS